MRRAGDLYPRLCDPENLRLAFWKASRGKRHKPDVVRFRENLTEELDRLAEELAAERVPVGAYRYFEIRDPKPRTICAAPFRERVLHHAILNVCEPVFESYQIHDSYACRRGKGSYAALARAQEFARRHSHFAKLDVRKYFPSIDHEVLLGLLERRFKDRALLSLLGRIVESHCTAPGRGVPIGNLTSQYFANHYLAVLDHHVKEALRVRGYLRYMDDFVLWAEDRETLKGLCRSVRAFCRERLRLELKEPVLGRCADGMSALGYRMFPRRLTLTPRSRRRFAQKLAACERAYAEGRITEQQAALRAEPLLAFAGHATTRGLRNSVLGRRPRLEPGEPGRELEQ